MTDLLIHRAAAHTFVEQLLDQSRAAGLQVDDWIIDHFCFRVTTWDEYRQLTQYVQTSESDLSGRLLSEAEINGRVITTIRLAQPLQVRNKLIEALEIPGPKEGT